MLSVFMLPAFILHTKGQIPQNWRRCKNDLDHLTFKILRAQFLLHEDYVAYIESVESEVAKDPSRMWRFMSKRRHLSSITNIIQINDEITSDGQSICNLFIFF